MRIVHTFWVLALLVALASASQDIDIPLQEYGFTIGDQSGSMHLEFVIDLLCTHFMDFRYRLKTSILAMEISYEAISPSHKSHKIHLSVQSPTLPFLRCKNNSRILLHLTKIRRNHSEKLYGLYL